VEFSEVSYLLTLMREAGGDDTAESRYEQWDTSDIWEWAESKVPHPSDLVMNAPRKALLYLIDTPYPTLEDIKRDFLPAWVQARADLPTEAEVVRRREFGLDITALNPAELRDLESPPYYLEKNWNSVAQRWFASKKDGTTLPTQEF